MPEFDKPEAFGMHDNVNMVYLLNESNSLIQTLCSIHSKADKSMKTLNEEESPNFIVMAICKSLDAKMPLDIKKSEVPSKDQLKKSPKSTIKGSI
jgi:hypothetical protein